MRVWPMAFWGRCWAFFWRRCWSHASQLLLRRPCPKKRARKQAVRLSNPPRLMQRLSRPKKQAQRTMGGAVAILVVDFFTVVQSAPEDGQLCPAGVNGSTTEGGGTHGSKGAALAAAWIPHGELVYAHLKQQFDVGFTDVTQEMDLNDQAKLVERAEVDSGIVYLVQIDIGQGLTNDVLGQIDGVHQALKDKGVTNFVVNMSIVVKPCEKLFDSFDEYRSFIQCIPTLAEMTTILNAHSETFTNDEDSYNPIQQSVETRTELVVAHKQDSFDDNFEEYVDCATEGAVSDEIDPEYLVLRAEEYRAGFQAEWAYDDLVNAPGYFDDTIFIAAAGNDGLSYPYVPSGYGEVISVGAFTRAESLAYVPNASEWIWSDVAVFTDSAIIKATTVISPDGTMRPAEDEVILLGTSYAAPKMSYLAAMGLLNGLDRELCGDELAYADQYDGMWSSIPLSDLAREGDVPCAHFLDPMQTRPPRE